jgi:hypothetical protein
MCIYAAMAPWFTPVDGALAMQGLLMQCEAEESEFYSDGLHLNAKGIHVAAMIIESIIQDLALDAIVGDSCLCATEASWMDREGSVIQPLLSVRCYPAAGRGCYRGGFDEKILKAYYAEIQPKTIGILCAGNDIARYNYAQDIDEAMKQLKDYWAEVGVAIVSIGAVPHRFRDSEF